MAQNVYFAFPVIVDFAAQTWSGDQTFAEGVDLSFGTTTGTNIGTATDQKLGFYAKTPVVQPTNAAQAAVTVSTITTASTTTTPAGYATTTQADALAASVAATVTLVNRLRTDLVALGLIKGS